MKNIITFLFIILTCRLLFSQTLSLGSVKNETAPAITQQSTQISVLTSTRYCRFIPGNSGLYTIRSIGSSDGWCELYDSAGTVLATGDDQDGSQFIINDSLFADHIYYLGIRDWNMANTFTLNVTGGTLEIPLGLKMDDTAPLLTQTSTKIYSMTSFRFCRFIPSNTAEYTIRSAGSADAYCKLYDDGYNLLVHGNDEIGNQFIIRYTLNAGHTYYLAITDYSKPNAYILNILGGLLHIDLSSFNASISDGKVLIIWETTMEVNNYGFDVERSLVTSLQSLAKWEKVGFVAGAINSNTAKKYWYIDENPVSGVLQYRLKQIDNDGNFSYYPSVSEVNFSPTEVKENRLPTEFRLSQNYPNPFNPSTIINYQLPVTGHVTLKVYNILGNEIATLVDENKLPGYYNVEFNAGNLAAGVYVYRLNAGKYTEAKKLMLIK